MKALKGIKSANITKSLVAYVTLVWSITCVNTLVCVKVTDLSK